jgi:hypothetical protein
MYDPGDLRYVHGACLSEEKARRIVRDVIDEGGVEALQLADKPPLRRLFVDFAAGRPVGPTGRAEETDET